MLTGEVDRACCISGQGNILEEKRHYLQQRVSEEISLAILEGYTHFMTCFTEEFDLIFAQTIDRLKDGTNKIVLEAVLPFNSYIEKRGRDFKEALGVFDRVGTFVENETPECYEEASRFLIRNSERLIVVYDGESKNVTFANINLAQMLGKEIRLIEI